MGFIFLNYSAKLAFSQPIYATAAYFYARYAHNTHAERNSLLCLLDETARCRDLLCAAAAPNAQTKNGCDRLPLLWNNDACKANLFQRSVFSL